MDYLADKLLKHFMQNGGKTQFTSKATVQSFMKTNGYISTKGGVTTTDFKMLTRILNFCQKLQNEGILLFFSNHLKMPFLGNSYVCIKYNQEIADYGGYEFLVQGFAYIQEIFSNSVIPVEILDSNGISDIGTCFVIGPNILVTAKHCIENKNSIKICVTDLASISPSFIATPEEEAIDICIIRTEGEPFKEIMQFDMYEPETLMEVLTMGYPPIPGFDAIQISEKANIGAYLKNSRGSIIGNGKSYLDKMDYFLINAKVKSGNSGSPVINKFGQVVGIVTHIPLDSNDKDKLDSLGYGMAVSSSHINTLLDSMNYRSDFKELSFNNHKDGTFSTL